MSSKNDIIMLIQRMFPSTRELKLEELLDEPLTGARFRLSAEDLLYLLFEIEKKYALFISHEYLNNYGFNSINKIIKIVDDLRYRENS